MILIIRNFQKKQINSILRLSKFLIKKYKIKPKNILGHSDVSPYRKKDPGEKFPWKYLANNKVGIWHTLTNQVLKKNRMAKIDDLSKEYFVKNLFNIGYSKTIPKNFSKNRYLTFVIKAFQRRFRQEVINGKIDKECLLISKNLIKKLH
ncbi:N-acetylmuramoyl-L-alanine amidase [Candidatus Pelagibacter sp.]|nr:N-acetylmuramoyl-L-alanine amidase [Candidatus Pelagibacter sp.]